MLFRSQAIANHPLVVYDPRAEEIRERAAELVSRLPRFDGTLEAALTEAGDARGAEDLQRTRQAAAAAATAYLQTLDRDEVVRHLDDTFAGSASIYGEMQRALTRMKNALQQA